MNANIQKYLIFLMHREVLNDLYQFLPVGGFFFFFLFSMGGISESI